MPLAKQFLYLADLKNDEVCIQITCYYLIVGPLLVKNKSRCKFSDLEKEIYYSISAEMILAQPSSCSSQHTRSPTSGTARFAYVPRELPPGPAT